MRRVLDVFDFASQDLNDPFFCLLSVHIANRAFRVAPFLGIAAKVIAVLVASLLESVGVDHGAAAGLAFKDFGQEPGTVFVFVRLSVQPVMGQLLVNLPESFFVDDRWMQALIDLPIVIGLPNVGVVLQHSHNSDNSNLFISECLAAFSWS